MEIFKIIIVTSVVVTLIILGLHKMYKNVTRISTRERVLEIEEEFITELVKNSEGTREETYKQGLAYINLIQKAMPETHTPCVAEEAKEILIREIHKQY